MTTPAPSSYDTLPYASFAFAQTHPERLGVIARLFGMQPARSSQSRVLEIGCASGGNLLPMAAQNPNSTYVGIDLSSRQIADGKAVLAACGLSNVDLRHMDILAIDESMGKFDYIIAHGVYSWVPPAVQDKLLAVCKHNLAPQGVAYVSYNTYPGWHMRGMIRDMMAYHARQFADIKTKLSQARALLDFLHKHVPTESGPYGLLLKQEVEMLRKASDSYLAHEHLEEVNEPLYFHQFCERIGRHGLQYLGEAEFHTMLASNFPPEVAETLKGVAPNIVQMEQYMDFLRNRVFRQTLMVHQDVTLNRSLDWNSVQSFQAGSPLQTQSGKVDLLSGARERFAVPTGSGIETPEPIAKAALSVLSELWPQTIPVSDLRRMARERVSAAGAPPPTEADHARDATLVGSDVIRCFAAGIVELRNEPVPMPSELPARPRANVLARYQAQRGNSAVNLRHEPCNLDEFSRHVLSNMDGSKDSAALTDALMKLTDTGMLQVRQGEANVKDAAIIRGVVDQALPKALDGLYRSALIEA